VMIVIVVEIVMTVDIQDVEVVINIKY